MTKGLGKVAVEISGYDLQRRLGAGGMAEVFLAKKRGAEGTYKQLVLKRILPEHSKSRRFRKMFVGEAHLATRLNHPNIVQVYEFSQHEDDLLLSMEFVDGCDLGRLMLAAKESNRPIPPWVAAFVVAEVAKGLHYAHERRDERGEMLAIVHRDVSPQNILLSLGGVVKVADFGIASANLFREEMGVLKGKVGYMSPEQARGEPVDRRSDIYALGVVLYELLTGQSPYGKLKENALAEAVCLAAYKPPLDVADDLPPELAAVIERAMAAQVGDRFSNARNMAGAIARILLEKQQLVDNTTLELVIAELLGEYVNNEVEQDARLTMAAGKKSESMTESSATDAQLIAQRAVDEVRHVVLLKLCLEGYEQLQELEGVVASRRAVSVTRATLDDIAYKRGAKWTWQSDNEAFAVVGLMANPARAPNNAARIAVDVHEFMSSRSEELPVQLRASLALVRGIARGKRDEVGHLVGYNLNESGSYLAQELSKRAPFGKTWVAGGLYRMVRNEFHWSDGPSIGLDDADEHELPARVKVHLLLRPLSAAERMTVASLNSSGFVGREAELADLTTAFHSTLRRPGRMSMPPMLKAGHDRTAGSQIARVVIGEMGIGKTALVEAFLGDLPAEVQIFRAECSPVKVDVPYTTLVDLLREILGVEPKARIEEIVQRMRVLLGAQVERSKLVLRRLADLVAGHKLELQDADAAAHHREIIAHGARLLIGTLAAKAAVIITIDGLQWADATSLAVLTQLLKRGERVPLLTLLVTRPEERINPYISGLLRTELTGLGADEQVRLVQGQLGVSDGVGEVCQDLVPRVGGNPYFLLEMVDALLERGSLEIVEKEEGKPFLERNEERFGDGVDALPSTIEQLVSNRLEELPLAERDIVNWLAVAGGPLAEADLMALTRLTDDEGLSRLCARGLCDRRNRVIDFRHALARDVAYKALASADRSRMHRRLGDYLGTTALASGVSAVIVAQHFERGENPTRAAELFLEAANAAQKAHQSELSMRYFERALILLPVGDPRRMLAHSSLDRIYRQLGKLQERRKHVQCLRELARDARQTYWAAVALVRAGQLAHDDGALARGLPLAQHAAALAELANSAELQVEALILACNLLRDLGDVGGALKTCDRALSVTAPSHVSRRARAEVLRTKGVLLRRAGRINAAVTAHAEAIATLSALGAIRSEARARNALGFALFSLGRFEDCIAMCLSSLSIDVMIGGRVQVAKTLANVGLAYARLGALERGLAYLENAREAHERYDDHDGRVDTLLVTASVVIEAGELDRADELLGDAKALADVAASAYDEIHLLVVESLLCLARSKPRAAVDLAGQAFRRAEAQGLVSYQAYAGAIRAVALVKGEKSEEGVAQATRALSMIESMEGSEYDIEARSLCCTALQAAHEQLEGDGAGLVAHVRQLALDHASRLASYIRDDELRVSFWQRAVIRSLAESSAKPVSRHRASGDEPTI